MQGLRLGKENEINFQQKYYADLILRLNMLKYILISNFFSNFYVNNFYDIVVFKIIVFKCRINFTVIFLFFFVNDF